MAKARIQEARLKEIGNDTAFQQDTDDQSVELWELMKEKEKLQAEIEATSMEIDGWVQVLNCSTAHELDSLIDSFSADPTLLPDSFTVHQPSETTNHLQDYFKTITRLNAHRILDVAQASSTEDGNLFIKFPSKLFKRPDHECLLLLKPGEDLTYSVVTHSLPPSVPLDSLEKEYLKKPQGPDGLRTFIAVVAQYTRPYYSRLLQIMSAENLSVLQGTVRHNKAATTLSFILDLKLKEHPSLVAEFVLKFDPLDVLPHTVTATPFSLKQEQIPQRLQETLDEAAERMKTKTFPQELLEAVRGSRVLCHPLRGTLGTQRTLRHPSPPWMICQGLSLI
ncbi:uncharacterized protein LOC123501054 [Portunus trituberculatus]|uniref:uncharacterized protein LOC123501054 n=1 Tax=Portunus trituberculatus TaxID=210409 RepID=UPI001E1CD232|nr:uncharacterized protein LOC123501054 [Portunus trituberculatus]XP_045105569.1 uncharacterized protein LOC123501054 [Portunus trituberculatus]